MIEIMMAIVVFMTAMTGLVAFEHALMRSNSVSNICRRRRSSRGTGWSGALESHLWNRFDATDVTTTRRRCCRRSDGQPRLVQRDDELALAAGGGDRSTAAAASTGSWAAGARRRRRRRTTPNTASSTGSRR